MSNDTATGRTGMDTPVAQELWDALDRARADPAPRQLARVEDALFRHYLPMAQAVAQAHPCDDPDPEAVRQAAEVGLAQAILSWRQRDSVRFDRYARATITDQLRRHDELTARRDSRSPFPQRSGTDRVGRMRGSEPGLVVPGHPSPHWTPGASDAVREFG